MARFLRMVRQGRWARPTSILGRYGGHQADALRDLETNGNVLSVYLADTQQMIDQVVAALIANRENIANLDYTIIEGTLLSALDLQPYRKPGRHPIPRPTGSTSMLLI